MRLDKFLKVSRVLKRRTVAQEACAGNKVYLNSKQAKAGAQVKLGDIITIKFSLRPYTFKIIKLCEHIKADLAHTMYEVMDGADLS